MKVEHLLRIGIVVQRAAVQSILVICLSSCLSGMYTLAQATLGSAAAGGTVRDPTGAVVPGAKVVLTDTARDFSRETTSDSAGLFRFPTIPPSHYSLTVTKEAFETSQVTGIGIELGDSKTVDIVLQVGAVTSTVSVEANKATLLDIDSNAIGSVVSAKTIRDLPLNSQDFLQLATITAGVNAAAGASDNTGQIGHASRTVVLTGNGSASTEYTIDGIATRGSRLGESALNISTADIDQFKVQESFFMPDQGPDPGIVNVTTRGGTNGLHGEIYEFLKNDYIDAINYFATKPGELKRSQFGAALGGPIKRDKLWFFANYEGTRQISTGNSALISPTAAEFGGDFSALLPSTPIYDPATYNATTKTRQLFPNNMIPANRINAVAKALLAYYVPGSPTLVNGKNINFTPKSVYTDNQFGGRIDFALSKSQYIFVQYLHQNDPNLTAGSFPLTGTSYPNRNQLFVIQHTWTLRPSLINTFRFGVADLLALDANEGRSIGNIANMVGIPNTFDGRGVPAISLTGYTAFGNASGDLGNIDNNYQLDDGMTYVHSNHSYQFGGSVRYFRDAQFNANAQANSTITFAAMFTAQTSATGTAVKNTGNAFADFLLGDPSQATTGGLPEVEYRFTQFFPYYADTWKLSPSLTMNYGISWFLATTPNPQGIYPSYVHDFDYSTNLPTYEALGQVSPEVVPTPLNHFTPRLGFAFNPHSLPDTVIRAAFGTYFTDQSVIESQYTLVGPPYTVNTTLVNAPTNPLPVYSLGNNIFSALSYPPITPGFPAAIAAAGGSSFQVLNPHARTPYINQWNLSVQQALTRNDVLDVTYLGNSGHKLNNHYNPAACIPNVPVSYQCIPSTNPYPQYTSLLTSAFNGNSNYNALIAKYRHITSKGLTLDANYTYGKAMSDASARSGLAGNQIATCRRCDYGPTPYNVKHRFVASYVYELPYGRGKRFGSKAPLALDLLAGGWVITGIESLSTGVPLNFSTANATGVANATIRPNQVCNGSSPALAQSIRTNGFVYFNAACYPVPAVGYFGNSGFDPINGPGGIGSDLGAQKNFPLLPNERARLQLRIEAFNFVNHANFNAPGTVASTPASFGIITSAGAPRVFQAVAKVTF